jgi:K+-sensing histidine kinase KdpD
MMSAIESLEESFGAMLDISRLDAGVVQKSPQTFPIRDIFRRLLQQFGGDAESRDLALRFRATRRIVHSDPLLLERILANLVQNALRYTRRGGVLVAARRSPEGVALEVWDTGVGIPPDKQEMIFREFYQLDNPEGDGTGHCHAHLQSPRAPSDIALPGWQGKRFPGVGTRRRQQGAGCDFARSRHGAAAQNWHDHGSIDRR